MRDRVTTRESARPWAQGAGGALSCLAASLLLLVGNASARDCGLKLVGTTEISTPHDALVLMHVTINGHPVGMELDMASVGSSIQAEYVQPLGLLLRPAPVQTDFRTETQTFEMKQFVRLTSLVAGAATFNRAPVIATAAARSWMLTYASRQLYGVDQTSDREMTLSGLGPSRRVRVRLDSRSVAPTCSLTSRDTGAAYFLGQACRGAEAALYIGMDVLRHLHIYYAAKEQVLYFSDPEAGQ